MGEAARKISADIEVLDSFRQFSFFQGFPEDMLLEVASVTETMDFPDGTEILQQGQVNEYLFFLKSGRVGVYVDGGRVATLENSGDLVGEMSVISSQPCTASIIAEGDVRLFCLSSKYIKQVTDASSERFQLTLFRVYAAVLAEKLRTTNQKAKQFEELSQRLQTAQIKLRLINQDLEKKVEERTADLRQKKEHLEQQNTELVASNKKLEELYANKDVTFKKLNDLYKGHLVPLKKNLDNLASTLDPNTKSSMDSVALEMANVISLLEPITSIYRTEQAIRNKKVLLADSNKKTQIVAKMALGGSGASLDLASTLEEGKAKLSAQNYDLLFVDPNMVDLGELAKHKQSTTEVVLMTSDDVTQYLPKLKKMSFMPQIVSREEKDRTFTIKNIMTTVTKLAGRDVFGLEKYLSWGVEVQEHLVMSSQQRPKLIESVDSYLKSLGIRTANRERVRTVVEELLMNAIYDAPADKSGKSRYNHLPRTTDIELLPSERSRLRFATDGMLIAISVEDPFGSLSGNVILNYLDGCYKGQETGHSEEVSQNKGGAGRGLHMIVENSDLTVFNIQPKKRTEVISLFNVEIKEMQQKNPTFHLFII